MPKLAAVIAVVCIATPAFAQPVGPAITAPTVDTRTPAQAPAAEPSALPSFGSLFYDLGDDFRRLPSRETGLILGVAGGASLAIRSEDVKLTRQAAGSQTLDTMFEPGEVMGGGVVQFGVAFATYTAGRVAHSPRVAVLGAELVRAQFVNSVLTQSIKFSVRRPRPDGGRFSFPSGHTSGSFATAAVLQRHFGWRAGLPAYGLAAFVAGSRLQENRHFMSDVLFGAAIGIVSGRAVSVGHGQARFAVTPFATLGGGGISLSLVGVR